MAKKTIRLPPHLTEIEALVVDALLQGSLPEAPYPVNRNFLDWLLTIDVKPTELRVLIAIKCFDGFWTDFPTQRELGEFCRVAEQDVWQALRTLVKKGFV